VRNKSSKAAAYRATFSAAAKLLLDSESALAEAEGLFADAEFVFHPGNVQFFAETGFPRGLANLTREAQASFAQLGLAQGRATLADADWDYAGLAQGLKNTRESASPRFNEQQVAAVVTRRQQQGKLSEGELFSFEIFFEPNQNEFSPDLYHDAFKRVIDLASTYGGALITVEGHSDPMGYLRDKKGGLPEIALSRVKQSAKNLSLSRAIAVRNSVMSFAAGQGITLDPTQFAVVGLGLSRPRSGMCGEDPCAPKTEREWRDNMRVEFRILQVEAESSVFRPL
jgi:outer membrane protein OmpA-like peptidoglycan-associated protein